MNKNISPRIFCIGDIHGGYRGLRQVLERSGFDKEVDVLITLGDYTDGWSQPKEVIDELLTIKNLIPLLGNHDQWVLDFYTGKMHVPEYISKKMIDEDTIYFKLNDNCEMRAWYSHGGKSTLNAFGSEMEEKYLNFFKKLQTYHIHNNIIFVHAGIDHCQEKIEEQDDFYLIWDRFLITKSYEDFKSVEMSQFTSMFYHGLKEIYVGHTPTIVFSSMFTTPQNWGKIWAVDTGACFTGKLSMINIETKEFFQSDSLNELYPDEAGRNEASFNEINKKGEN